MSKLKALFILFLILWPAIYMALCFALMAYFFITTQGKKPEAIFPPYFIALFAIHILTIFESLGVVAYCLYHLVAVVKPQQNKIILWAIVLMLGNMFATPVYWYLYIWTPLKNGTLSSSTTTHSESL